jgi:hypothetical protein
MMGGKIWTGYEQVKSSGKGMGLRASGYQPRVAYSVEAHLAAVGHCWLGTRRGANRSTKANFFL